MSILSWDYSLDLTGKYDVTQSDMMLMKVSNFWSLEREPSVTKLHSTKLILL